MSTRYVWEKWNRQTTTQYQEHQIDGNSAEFNKYYPPLLSGGWAYVRYSNSYNFNSSTGTYTLNNANSVVISRFSDTQI